MESRQYIVLTGDERVEDLDRILGRITLPNPISISYRHTGHKLHDLLIEPFVVALKGSGVKEVATLFAEPHQVDQLRIAGLEHGIDISES